MGVVSQVSDIAKTKHGKSATEIHATLSAAKRLNRLEAEDRNSVMTGSNVRHAVHRRHCQLLNKRIYSQL